MSRGMRVAITGSLVVACACSDPNHCASIGMGADRQGACAPLCTPDAGPDGGGCAAGATCENIPQPHNSGDKVYVTAYVCCTGGGC